jgi:hypothetical protein
MDSPAARAALSDPGDFMLCEIMWLDKQPAAHQD